MLMSPIKSVKSPKKQKTKNECVIFWLKEENKSIMIYDFRSTIVFYPNVSKYRGVTAVLTIYINNKVSNGLHSLTTLQ